MKEWFTRKPSINNEKDRKVNPHTPIGKPLLVIIFIFLIYGYFYITTGVPSYLDFPPLVNNILVETGYLE